MPGETSKPAVHRRDDVLIDLDPEHRALAEQKRRQDIPPPADPDHQDSRVLPHVVHQVRAG